ncbi:MAG: pilus assembly protein PilM [Halanaerobiales bacterium]|nr:pilus assembly protein PilM [Halanaerobiales bacterium]
MKKRVIGLEFDDRGIYFVELIKKKDQISIRYSEKIELPSEVIINGKLIDSYLLNQVLTSFLPKTSYFKPIPVVVGISGVQALVRKINIPIVPSKEMDKIIRWEGENILPYSIEEVFYDYQVVGKSNENYEIIFIAIHHECLIPYIKMFQNLKIPIQNLTIQPFGLVNYIEYIGDFDRFSGVIVRAGNTKFDLIMVLNGKIELIRTVSLTNDNQLQKDLVDLCILELTSTLEYFYSTHDTILKSGIFFGSRQMIQKIRLKMTTFHWRHLGVDLKKIQSKEKIGEEMVWELPCVLGFCLQELV